MIRLRSSPVYSDCSLATIRRIVLRAAPNRLRGGAGGGPAVLRARPGHLRKSARPRPPRHRRQPQQPGRTAENHGRAGGATAILRARPGHAMGSATYEWIWRHQIQGEDGESQPWPYEQPTWVFTKMVVDIEPAMIGRFMSIVSPREWIRSLS
jgi:hypothetical protein